MSSSRFAVFRAASRARTISSNAAKSGVARVAACAGHRLRGQKYSFEIEGVRGGDEEEALEVGRVVELVAVGEGDLSRAELQGLGTAPRQVERDRAPPVEGEDRPI